MDALLFGHKVNGVQAVLDLLHLGILGNGLRRCHACGQIERRDARHFERELALAAHVRRRYGGRVLLQILALPIAALAIHFDIERRPLDVVVGELQVQHIIARLRGLVGNL